MIILSNCLTETADEGTRKLAANMVRCIKEHKPETTVISCDSKCPMSDVQFSVNKLMLNKGLLSLLRKKQEPLLYIPSPAKSLSLGLRLFVLSRAAREGITVLLTMTFPIDFLSKMLIKFSGARFILLSGDSGSYFEQALGQEVKLLKAGVDTRRFCPVDLSTKRQLREKYGLPQDKTIVFHAGHLKQGRNISQFLKLKDEMHGLLVVSTQTADEQDAQLRQQLLEKKNITLIDSFVPDIQELYQLSDVYLFPVQQKESCIDLPLSVLEAAACDIPVVTTPFGQMKALIGQEGFYEISDFEEQALISLLQKACEEQKKPRAAVLDYDWCKGVRALLQMQCEERGRCS